LALGVSTYQPCRFILRRALVPIARGSASTSENTRLLLITTRAFCSSHFPLVTQGKKKSPVDCVDFDIFCMGDEQHGFLVRQVQPCTSWDGAVFASRVNDGPLLLFVCAQALRLQLFLCRNFLLSLSLSISICPSPGIATLHQGHQAHRKGQEQAQPQGEIRAAHAPLRLWGVRVFYPTTFLMIKKKFAMGSSRMIPGFFEQSSDRRADPHFQCDHDRLKRNLEKIGVYQYGGGLPVAYIEPHGAAERAGLQK